MGVASRGGPAPLRSGSLRSPSLRCAGPHANPQWKLNLDVNKEQ